MSNVRDPSAGPTSQPQSSATSGTGFEPGRSSDESFAPPVVSLPKGGGAIRGIGEKFGVNSANGTGTLTIPLPVSPGRAGFTPPLSLRYDSGASNGPYGLGWSVDYPAISRRTDRGIPRYHDADDSDVFVLSGAEDLVPVVHSDGTRDQIQRDGYLVARYRPRIEGMFARIERWTNLADPSDVFWRSISPSNVSSWFGKTPASRVSDPADPRRIFAWLLCESYDDKGNASVYEYVAEDGVGVDLGLASESGRSAASRSANRYLKRVKYGNRTSRLTQPDLSVMEWLFELVMDFGDHADDAPGVAPDRAWPVRPDPFSSFRAGFEVRTYRRCRRILMFHRFAELGGPPRLVRSLELDYDDFAYAPGFDPSAELAWQGSTRIGSLLRGTTASGYSDSGLKKSWPPVELTYSRPRIDPTVRVLTGASDRDLPIGVDGTQSQWLDLDREGLSGVLTRQADAWWYKPNRGDGELGPAQRVARLPSLGHDARAQFLDLGGNGALDLVQLNRPVAGFFARDDQGSWTAFTAFASQPNIAWDDPNLRLVDLTGDGRADVLITHDDALYWHESLGEAGFGPRHTAPVARDEARGARLVFEDGTETIFLADMSGDGLPDLVRIRASQICYWPNLGHGRFGPRVVMDRAPVLDTRERFDPRRVRLADIDGSGVTDLIYLGSDGVRLYFNRSGNGWTAAHELGFPRVDSTTSVQVVDLLGNGTACLVWSSPLPDSARSPLRFVDLMGGQKPHLLIGFENNLGARSAVTYCSSTKFYLADRKAGRPWLTRLPFPVQVVERVDAHDDISRNHFVTRYTYRHGYFDPVEREFRGFGMVEQIDTEELSTLSASGALSSAADLDSSHAPPALTRTWFHTGVYLGRDRVSRFHAGLLDGNDTGEYYREPGLSDAEAARLLLDDTILPPGLTTDEEREACRALKGAMLRQETYALDGSDRQPHPYAVTEQNFTLRMLQPRRSNPHAVFFMHARESLTYHYEREPSDPRVAHALTLTVDDFGNTLTAASAVYGRRQPDLALEARDQAEQAAIHVVYTDRQVTSAVDAADAYRAPQPSESRRYELTGLGLATGALRFTLDQLLAAGPSAAEIAYEQAVTSGVLQKRLIEDSRTLYRSDDLTSVLPLGQSGTLAIPAASYQLVLTPGLIDAAYGTRITAAMLAAGGMVQLAGDPRWWIPSGRVFYSASSSDDAAAELAAARQHFFLPRRFVNPFGQTASVTYDAYDLLVLATRDPLGNLVSAGERDGSGNVLAGGHDYRVLQPRLVTDANGNRNAAVFDARGLLVGSAVMGKRDETPRRGDVLDGFVADLSDDVIAAHLADPLAAPLAILGRATTRLVYDLFGYQRTRQQLQPAPSVVYALGRETHDADLAAGEQPRIQHSLAYSDGFGREIQKKVQAEAGPVPVRDPDTGQIVVSNGQPVLTTGDVAPRWVGSGWTIFDNKGQPVRQFEPFFTDTHRFELDVRIGVSPIRCFDPVGRVVATIHPDHGWDKVIIGPWREQRWDVNDTVLVTDPRLDPDVGDQFRRIAETDYLPTWYAQRQAGDLGADQQAAAAATAAHAATPSITHRDSLGRPFLTIAHNRFTPADAATGTPPTDEHYATRIAFDIQGNQREIRDTGDRIMVRGDHDLLGNRIHQISMEAGERWILNDITGQPIHTFNSRGHHVRTEYDALRRPLRSFVQGAAADPAAEILFAKTEYGEDQPNDTAHNLRTRLVRQYDSAGVVTNLAFDFKGNLLQTSRQLASDPTSVIDWSASPALEAETFTSTSAYDALNRPTAITTPDASRYRPRFNEANLLERVDVDVHGSGPTVNLVSGIAYDAKGQRTRIAYGNATATDYTYDPRTFRLVGLTTTRTADQRVLQDLAYTFDAVGNVVRIGDAAQQTVYFNNQVVAADCRYVYDAAYRLIHAEGREHIGQALQPQTTWDDAFRVQLPQPGDGQAMRRYREDYRYDAVGNFLAVVHQATGGNWTRNYTYNEASAIEPARISNRLTSTTVGTDPSETYSYDAQGNLTSQPHLTVMQWDFRDQLSATARQVVGTGTPETTYYVYDVAGRRTRKVNRRQNGTRKNERIYLEGYEIYREYAGDGTTVTMQRDTLHVMDDSQRIALIEIQTVASGVPQPAAAPVIRHQYGNHLGSAALELDGAGAVISYEEYYPYGGTSYQAMSSAPEVSLKRYRYTAMERDSETGFNYHTARYYLPWLGRWLSPDAGGLSAGLNLYGYCLSNPISSVDLNGREPSPVSLGHAGDPDLPSPATAKRADLVRYAAKYGFDYTGPDPTPDQFHMTDQGGQWIVESKYLKPHTYNPGDEYRGGFGMQPGDGVKIDDGTIPTGPYQTSGSSSRKPASSSGGSSAGAGKSRAGASAGASPAPGPAGRPAAASAAPGDGNGRGTAEHARSGNPDGFLPAWVADVAEIALIAVAVVAAVAAVAVFATAFVAALAVEGTSIATATTLAAGETIIGGTGAVAAGAGGAAALENAAETEGGAAAAVVEKEVADGPPPGFTRLFRAVEGDELKDVKRFGDYNIHPNSTFKRFAFSEGDLDTFIRANPDRTYTKTFIDVPTSKLGEMFEHPDAGGVGRAIGIDVYETPEFYDWLFGPPTIIE